MKIESRLRIQLQREKQVPRKKPRRRRLNRQSTRLPCCLVVGPPTFLPLSSWLSISLTISGYLLPSVSLPAISACIFAYSSPSLFLFLSKHLCLSLSLRASVCLSVYDALLLYFSACMSLSVCLCLSLSPLPPSIHSPASLLPYRSPHVSSITSLCLPPFTLHSPSSQLHLLAVTLIDNEALNAMADDISNE